MSDIPTIQVSESFLKKQQSTESELATSHNNPETPEFATSSQTPRTAFLQKKFPNELQPQEHVLANFSCSVSSARFSLSGMLYLTSRAIYFYSPFNAKTLIGGQSSKICLPYTVCSRVKKESHLLIFNNALRLSLRTRQQVLFQNFLSRDTCYGMIANQIKIAQLLKPTKEQQQYLEESEHMMAVPESDSSSDEQNSDMKFANVFDQPSESLDAQKTERIRQMRDDIPQPDDFPWQCHTEVFRGVPLKHVVAHFFSRDKISNFDGTEQKSLLGDFLLAGGNHNVKWLSEDPWPQEWLDLHSYRQSPVRLATTVMDLENRCPNPKPMQPASTQQKVTNFNYFVSNQKFYCLSRSEGRGYTFCERIIPEILYEVTQTGTCLETVETVISVRARFFIRKSIGLLHSVVMKGAEPQVKGQNSKSFVGLAEKVQKSWQVRIRQQQQHSVDNSSPRSQQQIEPSITEATDQQYQQEIQTLKQEHRNDIDKLQLATDRLNSRMQLVVLLLILTLAFAVLYK